MCWQINNTLHVKCYQWNKNRIRMCHNKKGGDIFNIFCNTLSEITSCLIPYSYKI
jgi:hypothetical protein